jgi:hypothetical protein
VGGTLHLHPAETSPLWHAARRAALGTDPALGADEVEAVRAAVWEALEGRCLLPDELAEEVVKRVGTGPRERLWSGFAFFLGELCQGPPQGARITLARPDQWIEGWREDTDESTRRYERFAAGSSTPTDELGADRRRRPLELRPRGRRVLPRAGRQGLAAARIRRLRDGVPRARPARAATRARARRAAWRRPLRGVRFVLVDGIAAGLWERRKRGRRIELDLRLAGRIGKTDRAAIEREAERVGAFLGLEPIFSVGRRRTSSACWQQRDPRASSAAA